MADTVEFHFFEKAADEEGAIESAREEWDSLSGAYRWKFINGVAEQDGNRPWWFVRLTFEKRDPDP